MVVVISALTTQGGHWHGITTCKPLPHRQGPWRGIDPRKPFGHWRGINPRKPWPSCCLFDHYYFAVVAHV